MKKTTVAICYDFDKTLSKTEMQAFAFIPNLGLTESQFWQKVEHFVQRTGADRTLAYLRVMLDECTQQGISLTREYLVQQGKKIQFFDGVSTWFKRLNAYAKQKNITLEHYIISSGNREIVEGCKIFDQVTDVFGCEFLYDQNGLAYWPKNAVNYTLKTQYLFRISKGTFDGRDEVAINKRTKEKHVHFHNMIYIGDGLTDIPCMTLVKEKGGTAISVYQTKDKAKSQNLLMDNRVNYMCKSSYKSGSALEKLMHLIIDSLALKEVLMHKENSTKKNHNIISKKSKP